MRQQLPLRRISETDDGKSSDNV